MMLIELLHQRHLVLVETRTCMTSGPGEWLWAMCWVMYIVVYIGFCLGYFGGTCGIWYLSYIEVWVEFH